MANEKKIQKAAIKFRRKNPEIYNVRRMLLSYMADFITRSGAPEVTVGFENERYYEYTNN